MEKNGGSCFTVVLDKKAATEIGKLDAKSITEDLDATNSTQVIELEDKLLSKVTINIPDTLIADNIKQGVNIGGISGTMVGQKAEQTKTVTPTSSQQVVKPDTGKALSQVTVKAIPSTYVQPTGNVNITGTSAVDVTNYATATVQDADLVAGNIKNGVNILGIVGTYEGSGGGNTITLANNESFNNLYTNHRVSCSLVSTGLYKLNVSSAFNNDNYSVIVDATSTADILVYGHDNNDEESIDWNKCFGKINSEAFCLTHASASGGDDYGNYFLVPLGNAVLTLTYNELSSTYVSDDFNNVDTLSYSSCNNSTYIECSNATSDGAYWKVQLVFGSGSNISENVYYIIDSESTCYGYGYDGSSSVYYIGGGKKLVLHDGDYLLIPRSGTDSSTMIDFQDYIGACKIYF